MTIEEFDALPHFAKNRQLRFAEKQQKKQIEDKQYLKTADLEGKAEVVFADEDYAIIKQFPSSVRYVKDDLFTTVYQKEGKWWASCTYFPTFEDTLFYILGVIKEGTNSHFGEYVSKLFKAL